MDWNFRWETKKTIVSAGLRLVKPAVTCGRRPMGCRLRLWGGGALAAGVAVIGQDGAPAPGPWHMGWPRALWTPYPPASPPWPERRRTGQRTTNTVLCLNQISCIYVCVCYLDEGGNGEGGKVRGDLRPRLLRNHMLWHFTLRERDVSISMIERLVDKICLWCREILWLLLGVII